MLQGRGIRAGIGGRCEGSRQTCRDSGSQRGRGRKGRRREEEEKKKRAVKESVFLNCSAEEDGRVRRLLSSPWRCRQKW